MASFLVPGIAAATEPPPIPSATPTAVTQPIKPLTVQPVVFQPADAPKYNYLAIFDIPSPNQLFRLEGEKEYRERYRLEYKERFETTKDLEFPKEPQLTRPDTVYAGRVWPLQVSERVASYVCYNPLYFEEKNAERYGWDAGIFQPFISAGYFYADLVKLPYEMGVQGPCSCEYNTGYCLPGDPVSYYLYYPAWSWKGAAFQTGAVLGLIAIFP